MSAIHRELSFTAYSKNGLITKSEQIALEIEVMLSVNGEDWLNFRCSPDNLDTLAAGFLFNEMIIQSKKEILSTSICENMQNIDVWLSHSAIKPQTWSRTSGCNGGVSAINSIEGLIKPSSKKVSISQVRAAVDLLLNDIKLLGSFIKGVHSTVIVKENEILSRSLDIGRHNTLDKIAGDCLLKEATTIDTIMVTTGRISADMVFKAARIGAPVLISLHSASSLALDFAQELGITLIGHAHHPQMEILTGIERITFS